MIPNVWAVRAHDSFIHYLVATWGAHSVRVSMHMSGMERRMEHLIQQAPSLSVTPFCWRFVFLHFMSAVNWRPVIRQDSAICAWTHGSECVCVCVCDRELLTKFCANSLWLSDHRLEWQDKHVSSKKETFKLNLIPMTIGYDNMCILPYLLPCRYGIVALLFLGCLDTLLCGFVLV